MAGRVRIILACAVFLLAAPWTACGQGDSDAQLYREKFRCAQLPPEVAEQLREIVTYSGDAMLIRTKSGNTVELKSAFSEDEPDTIRMFCVKDYFPEEGILLVDVGFYEDGGFVSVNLNTGDLVHYRGLYAISPDRKRLFHEDYYQYELHYVQVLQVTSCGLVQEFILLRDNAFLFLNSRQVAAVGAPRPAQTKTAGARAPRRCRSMAPWPRNAEA
jgi:hypothetical protein